VLLTAGMLWAGRLSWLGWKTWNSGRNSNNKWQLHSASLLLPGAMWPYIW